MVNKPLDMKYVYKRDRYLEKRRSLDESSQSIIDKFLTLESPNRYQIESFFNNCPPYKDAISLLETFYSDNMFKLLESSVQKVVNEVIPTIENRNLSDFIDLVESSDIGESNKDKLISEAKLYKSVDRIRKNHKNLSKKFTLEVFTNKAKSDKDKFFSICEMVDTYQLSNYIKMNIVLEETGYVSYMEGVHVNPESMVENVLNYFLLKEDNTTEDINSYLECINKSKVIPYGSDSRIKWFTEFADNSAHVYDMLDRFNLDISDCEYRLNEWKVLPTKNTSTLLEMIQDNLSNIGALRNIIETYNDFNRINEKESELSSFIENMDCNISRVEATNIMNIIKENALSEDLNPIIESLNMIMEENINDDVYTNSKVDKDDPMTFSSDEIDKFKMHNLITDAQSAGEFLDQVYKSSSKETPLDLHKVLSSDYDYDKIFKESSVIDYVDNSDHISLPIRSYTYNESSKDALYEFANNVNNCINNILYRKDTMSYYILGENTLDFYIRTKYNVLLTESELYTKGFSNYEKRSICDINRISSLMESFIDSPLPAIMNKLQDRNYAATISVDEAVLVFDILSPYLEGSDAVSEFVNMCREEDNPNYRMIKINCHNIMNEGFNIDDDHLSRLNLCTDIMGLNESIINKAKENIKSAVKDLDPTGKLKKKDEQNKDKKVSSNSVSEEKEDDKSSSVKDSKAVDNKEESSKDEKKEADNKINNTSKENNNGDVKDFKSNASSNESKEDDKSSTMKSNASGVKEEKKGITITDAKLAWQGVKSKLKSASAKEKEISRDVDMEFNNLCKNIENATTVDHREEIITGQVNRSLSKIVKMAIGLAGVGATAGVALHSSAAAVAIPAFMAITGFAKSAHTSYKEKKLILDEIDIELQVLEREISRAESSGSTKKYRQLLTIQKNLQRRRQEIYYNLAKHGRKIPMQSTTGLRERE